KSYFEEELIHGNWYESQSNGIRWVFKFNKMEGKEYWMTKGCTPIDNYKTNSSSYLYDIKDIKPANMEEVYKFFPEEKENNMKKEIIGYKLIKPEYEEAALNIIKS